MKTKTIYHCEHCDKSFVSKITCENHEPKCLQRIIENEKLQGMFLCLMRHFESKGYTVAIRYNSKDKDDYIISVR